MVRAPIERAACQIGRQVRFVATVECDQLLWVRDRTGRVLPPDRASDGKALLTALDDRQFVELYRDQDGDLPGCGRS